MSRIGLCFALATVISCMVANQHEAQVKEEAPAAALVDSISRCGSIKEVERLLGELAQRPDGLDRLAALYSRMPDCLANAGAKGSTIRDEWGTHDVFIDKAVFAWHLRWLIAYHIRVRFVHPPHKDRVSREFPWYGRSEELQVSAPSASETEILRDLIAGYKADPQHWFLIYAASTALTLAGHKARNELLRTILKDKDAAVENRIAAVLAFRVTGTLDDLPWLKEISENCRSGKSRAVAGNESLLADAAHCAGVEIVGRTVNWPASTVCVEFLRELALSIAESAKPRKRTRILVERLLRLVLNVEVSNLSSTEWLGLIAKGPVAKRTSANDDEPCDSDRKTAVAGFAGTQIFASKVIYALDVSDSMTLDLAADEVAFLRRRAALTRVAGEYVIQWEGVKTRLDAAKELIKQSVSQLAISKGRECSAGLVFFARDGRNVLARNGGLTSLDSTGLRTFLTALEKLDKTTLQDRERYFATNYLAGFLCCEAPADIANFDSYLTTHKYLDPAARKDPADILWFSDGDPTTDGMYGRWKAGEIECWEFQPANDASNPPTKDAYWVDQPAYEREVKNPETGQVLETIKVPAQKGWFIRKLGKSPYERGGYLFSKELEDKKTGANPRGAAAFSELVGMLTFWSGNVYHCTGIGSADPVWLATLAGTTRGLMAFKR